MICKNCNTENIPGALFCNHCGAALGQESAAVQNSNGTTSVAATTPR